MNGCRKAANGCWSRLGTKLCRTRRNNAKQAWHCITVRLAPRFCGEALPGSMIYIASGTREHHAHQNNNAKWCWRGIVWFINCTQNKRYEKMRLAGRTGDANPAVHPMPTETPVQCKSSMRLQQFSATFPSAQPLLRLFLFWTSDSRFRFFLLNLLLQSLQFLFCDSNGFINLTLLHIGGMQRNLFAINRLCPSSRDG
jgi:hypothetical protein